MTSLPARHELLMSTVSLYFSRIAKCTCGEWRSENTSHDQLLENYQLHRDDVDEAARFESQRLDNAAARAVNLGAK